MMGVISVDTATISKNESHTPYHITTHTIPHYTVTVDVACGYSMCGYSVSMVIL